MPGKSHRYQSSELNIISKSLTANLLKVATCVMSGVPRHLHSVVKSPWCGVSCGELSSQTQILSILAVLVIFS